MAPTPTASDADRAAAVADPAPRRPDLLRVATAGSVDDGKSTLIGRLLVDSKQVLVDQLEQVQQASVRRHGEGVLDLSLLTDGLRAEREQGITIDVAYRYFTTAARTFVLADTPGHVQYTRNMVTGASTADLAIVLVDARNGVSEQTRRHAQVAALLGIPHVTVAVNKMDLVDWSEARFDEIEAEMRAIAARIGIPDLHVIPISALDGDNVVERSVNTPWYFAPGAAGEAAPRHSARTLLEHLETVEVARDRNLDDVRFPVQWVIRPGDETGELHDYRGYAGQVASGTLRAGDEVAVMPAGSRTTIAAVETFDGALDAARPPMSVTVRLADDVDVSRGDVLVGVGEDGEVPPCVRELEADVCWMDERPLRAGARYLLKQASATTPVKVDAIVDRVELAELSRADDAEVLELNDIGRVRLRTKRPLLADPYARNRAMGAFILIDEGTNDTVAAGMIA